VTRLALSGGAYEARSVIASAQQCMNLYAETVPTGNQNTGATGQGEPVQFAYYPTPGLRKLSTLPQNGVRAIRQATTGGIYAVAGSGVYRLDPSTWAGTLLGSITSGHRTPVSMQDNGLQMAIVDGSPYGWSIDLTNDTFAAISDPTGMFSGADVVQYLDTYLLFNKPRTPQFYSSDSLSLKFDPLWFANKQSFSDLLVTLAVAKREIWLLGDRTSEVWYNSGKPDFTFEEQPGTFVDHGCCAKYSAAVYDNSVFWLSRDRQGRGFVIQGAGYQTKRVSTHAIEQELAGYATLSDAIGFCYGIAGHAFYVLTFPKADRTWVYDIVTGLWHEWCWIDSNGDEHRHRANCCYPCNDTIVVGDWQNGNLYALDRDVYTDDERPIKRVRAYPHLINDANRVFYRMFVADLETGWTPQDALVTSTDRIITWLPLLAQFNGMNVGAITVTTGGPLIDWDRDFVYMLGQTGYQQYTTDLETQTPLASLVGTPTRFVFGADIDPLGGYLLVQTDPGNPNGVPVSKLDPATFAVLDTFGVVTSFPSYPASVWVGQYIVCVVCNGVSFGFLKSSVSSGIVSAFCVDTMEHAGFSQAVVSGSTNNRGFMVAGQSGENAASVFLSWDATTTIKPSVPLYRIDIAASATSYDPASWPTTNPGITWTTVGTVAVSAVDPAWTGFTVQSLGYDLADGNVIWIVGTQTAADGYHVMKLSAQTAAVLWNIHIDTVVVDLGKSRINGSLWMIANAGAAAGATTSYRINTLTGTMETQPLSGVFASSGPHAQISDSQSTLIFYGGTFADSTTSPIPVDGSADFTGGWALMGGQTVITETKAVADDNLINLEWSDDRGHSYGSPVSQSIGDRGEYRTSLQWQRLGMCRDRVFRISWSVPLRTALQGAFVDINTTAKT